MMLKYSTAIMVNANLITNSNMKSIHSAARRFHRGGILYCLPVTIKHRNYYM